MEQVRPLFLSEQSLCITSVEKFHEYLVVIFFICIFIFVDIEFYIYLVHGLSLGLKLWW